MKNLKIGIIGSGNMAFCLGITLKAAGFTITEVIARNKREGKKLSLLLNAEYHSDLQKISGSAHCYFICLQDLAIAPTVKAFPFANKTLFHTSGSIPISVFTNYKGAYGVFYPVQTIKKGITTDWKNTPICIESNNATTLLLLNSIAKKISKQVYKLSSDQRMNLHLAAVFANNFTNACFSMASEILKESDLPFDLVKPLILSTALNVQKAEPVKVQTGPAKRNDLIVLKKHQALLKESPELLKVYRLLSNYIKEFS